MELSGSFSSAGPSRVLPLGEERKIIAIPMPEFSVVIAYVVVSAANKHDNSSELRLAANWFGQHAIVQIIGLAHHVLAMPGMLLIELLAPIATGNEGEVVTTGAHSPKGTE
jgi:hypothetical protein